MSQSAIKAKNFSTTKCRLPSSGHTEVLVDGLFDQKNQYTGRFQFYDWWYS